MVSILLAVLVFFGLMALLGVGLFFGRSAIKGSCGGIGGGACATCEGQKSCKEEARAEA